MIGNILYVLPTGGYSGGANSIVQEVGGFLRMGLNAAIAVDAGNHAGLASAYASLPAVLSTMKPYGSPAILRDLLAGADVAVATVATSVPSLVKAWRVLPDGRRPRLFYYIQDYEPLFFAPGSGEWTAAHQSYEQGPDLRGMAKTDWLCRVVQARHGMTVARVKASIDHDVFFPLLHGRGPDRPSIAAMIRPHTPRRAPRRTCRVLNRLAQALGERVSITTFGCEADELRRHGLALAPSIAHHGRLTREQVAHVLRQTDLFLDLSDYQAFGRTGLEAMACGAVSLMPLLGGAGEFVIHGENGFLVDVREEPEILRTVQRFVDLPGSTRQAMRMAAIRTAADHTVQKACVSILEVFLSG